MYRKDVKYLTSILKALDNEREKAEPVLQSSASGKSKKKKKKKKKQGEEANSPSQVNGIRSVCKEFTSGKIKLIYLLRSPTLLQADECMRDEFVSISFNLNVSMN